MNLSSAEEPTDAATLLGILRKQWPIIVATTVALVALVLVLDLFVRSPQYQSSADVLIEPTSDPFSEQPEGDLDRAMRNQQVVAQSRPVEIRAAENLDVATDEDLGVDVSVLSGQDVLTITATASSPELAQERAEAYTTAYLDVRRELEVDDLTQVAQALNAEIASIDAQTEDPTITERVRENLLATRDVLAQRRQELAFGTELSRTGSTRLLSPAEVEPDAVSPNPVRDALLAAALGLLLGVGLAYLRALLSSDKRKIEDVLGDVPVLSRIPKVSHEAPELAVIDHPGEALAESVLRLQTALQFVNQVDGSKVFQVVSALPGEGKTTLSINLALSLAETGKSVVLVDGDLRRPRLSETLGLGEAAEGFRQLLASPEPRHRIPLGTLGNLSVLPAGAPIRRTPELLGSPRLLDLVEGLRATFDYVVFDSSPLIPVSDGAVLGRVTDALVLVVGEETQAETVDEVLTMCNQLQLKLAGAVLLDADSESTFGYGYGYGYGSHGTDANYFETPPAENVLEAPGSAAPAPEADPVPVHSAGETDWANSAGQHHPYRVAADTGAPPSVPPVPSIASADGDATDDPPSAPSHLGLVADANSASGTNGTNGTSGNGSMGVASSVAPDHSNHVGDSGSNTPSDSSAGHTEASGETDPDLALTGDDKPDIIDAEPAEDPDPDHHDQPDQPATVSSDASPVAEPSVAPVEAPSSRTAQFSAEDLAASRPALPGAPPGPHDPDAGAALTTGPVTLRSARVPTPPISTEVVDTPLVKGPEGDEKPGDEPLGFAVEDL